MKDIPDFPQLPVTALAGVGAMVDADALMLDGAVTKRVRLGRGNVFFLEGDIFNQDGSVNLADESALALLIQAPGWAEVAEAIGELEGLADWRPTETDTFGGGFSINALAEEAFADTVERVVRSKRWGPVNLAERTLDMTIMEAAARLRDGWRPRGWRKKHITKEKTK